LLSQCNEEEQTDLTIESKDGKEFKIDVPPGGLSVNTSSFTVPVVLYHRVCGQIFSDADVSDKFVGIKLKITHTYVLFSIFHFITFAVVVAVAIPSLSICRRSIALLLHFPKFAYIFHSKSFPFYSILLANCAAFKLT
jgi:hypothetical protein